MVDRLAITPNGKVDRKPLLDLAPGVTESGRTGKLSAASADMNAARAPILELRRRIRLPRVGDPPGFWRMDFCGRSRFLARFKMNLGYMYPR